jgi:hypothetical protein
MAAWRALSTAMGVGTVGKAPSSIEPRGPTPEPRLPYWPPESDSSRTDTSR